MNAAFREVWAARDLLETKIAFNAIAAKDVLGQFGNLIDDLPGFMATSSTFELFRYDRCFDVTSENLAATRRWMVLTTTLSRYEGAAFAAQYDLSAFRSLLDIGGNSGEFALQLCRRFPRLSATVFDLPVVCAIGRDHIAKEPEAARICFVAGDMRHDDPPLGYDLVTLKSVLHDWPEPHARALLVKACRSVDPGGSLIIFERGPLSFTEPVPFAQLTNLVFFPFFRDTGIYVETLQAEGLSIELIDTFKLETEFHVIVAKRLHET